MPIHRLLKNGAYAPRDIEIMVEAYGEALRIAGVTDRTTFRAEELARRVVSQFETGETDPKLIAQRATQN
jgi:hypothetical protein